MISNSDITLLRKQTGAGIMKCKEALTETNGDIEAAKDYLRKKGVAAAEKKASRIASEGVVGSYIHMGGKIGVLVEVNSETDFVAQNKEFQDFVKDIAMQIAAFKPNYITRDDVPAEEVSKEIEILTEQVKNEGKPEAVIQRIVEGKLEKFYQDVCLIEQPFIKDPDKTIKDVLEDKIMVIGEKISIRRFTRYELGEGLEKKVENFAEEVQKQIKK